MAGRMQHAHAAVVWLDHWHAQVARRDHGAVAIVDLERGIEAERDFVARVAHMTDDCDRLMILGPGDDRLELQRACVGHRGPEIALDIEASPAPSVCELRDRLRLLEGDEPGAPAGAP